jgi:hypothetical protein
MKLNSIFSDDGSSPWYILLDNRAIKLTDSERAEFDPAALMQAAYAGGGRFDTSGWPRSLQLAAALFFFIERAEDVSRFISACQRAVDAVEARDCDKDMLWEQLSVLGDVFAALDTGVLRRALDAVVDGKQPLVDLRVDAVAWEDEWLMR